MTLARQSPKHMKLGCQRPKAEALKGNPVSRTHQGGKSWAVAATVSGRGANFTTGETWEGGHINPITVSQKTCQALIITSDWGGCPREENKMPSIRMADTSTFEVGPVEYISTGIHFASVCAR